MRDPHRLYTMCHTEYYPQAEFTPAEFFRKFEVYLHKLYAKNFQFKVFEEFIAPFVN